jgi:hypothetical protein
MTSLARSIVRLIGLIALLGGCTSGTGSVTSPAASGLTTATAMPEAAESPTPTHVVASSAPTPMPPLTASFTSPRMNYSVRYPEAWTAYPATELWLPGSRNLWDDPVGDRLEGRAVGFRGTSQALAKGQAADAWLKDYFGSGPSCGDSEQVHVGDHMGTVGLNGCAGRGRLGGRVYDVALVVDSRGYNFTMEGTVDHAFWLAMLATVKFASK